jgi:hypothetical protein
MVSFKNSALAVDILIIVKIHAAVNHIAGKARMNISQGWATVRLEKVFQQKIIIGESPYVPP